MPCLLDLPVEILTLIISEVLFTPRAAPRYPSTTGRVAVDLLYKPTKTIVHHEKRSTDISSLSTNSALLLTCRQLHDITKALLILPHPIIYHLDLAILNDAEQVTDIIATWLCLPTLTNRVDELHISVRSFGRITTENLPVKIDTCDDDLVEIYNDVFSWYEYNPFLEAWSIYSLFSRIVWYGPVFGVNGCDLERSRSQSAWAVPTRADRVLGVQRLTIDFSSPPSSSSSEHGLEVELEYPPAVVSYEWWWLRVHGKLPTAGATPTTRLHPHATTHPDSMSWETDLSKYKPRPEWLCRRLRDEIQSFLKFARGKEGYAAVLCARFETVRILVEGRMYWEVELDRVLENLREKRTEDIFFWEALVGARDRNFA
ncbi:hypothetical protein BJX62DRAFT_244746 [Aspergillus germanicus]